MAFSTLYLSAGQYRLLADTVLTVHFGIVAFVVLGLPMILAGAVRHWKWVRNLWLRAAHLVAIACVAAQTWFGIDCPLTTLELNLRLRSGAAAYQGSFVEYWLSRLIFYTAPPWVFILLYTGFALAVAYAWLRVPPEKPGGLPQKRRTARAGGQH